DVEELTPAEADAFEATLRDWFTQLRSLPPPSEVISGFDSDGSACWAFARHEFHKLLHDTVLDGLHEGPQEKAAVSHSKTHRIVLTHGDL
ncbi:uncharacterized protein C8Q71DRAFT_684447, partial [Rhodofomes roseus]